MTAHRVLAMVVAAAGLGLGGAGCGDDRPFFADAGALPPAAGFPATVSLGTAGCGAPASTANFTVENTGGADLPYSIVSSSPALTVAPASGTIIAGTKTTFQASLLMPASTAPGATVKATLTVTTNSPTQPTATVEVSAVAQGAQIVVGGDAAFGEVVRNTQRTQVVTIRNDGNGPAIVTLRRPSNPLFDVALPDSVPAQIAAHGRIDVAVRFAPTAAGAQSGTSALMVSGYQCGSPSPVAIAMSGTGVRGGEVLVQGGAAFGTVACGAAADTRQLTILNDGNLPATYTIAIPGNDPDNASYSFTVEGEATLAPEASATITVTRAQLGTAEAPHLPGDVDAELRIVTTAQGAIPVIHTVPLRTLLSGAFFRATRPNPTLDFGFRPASTTTTLPLVVENAGNVAAVPVVTGLSGVLEAADLIEIPAATQGAVFLRYLPGTEPVEIDAQRGAVTAAGACSAPVPFTVDAGTGPYADFDDIEVTGDCSRLDGGAPTRVANHGNRPLVIQSCRVSDPGEVGVELPGGPFEPIAPGTEVTGFLDYTRSSRESTAIIECAVNEPAEPTRVIRFHRDLTGADVVITAEGSTTFTCEQEAEDRAVTISNQGDAPVRLVPLLSPFGGYPLEATGEPAVVEPGQSLPEAAIHHHGDGGGSGSSACNITPGEDGVVYRGEVTVVREDEGGSFNICSVTALPVTMTRRVIDTAR